METELPIRIAVLHVPAGVTFAIQRGKDELLPPSENEDHEVLELDTDGKGFKPYVTNRFLKVAPPRS